MNNDQVLTGAELEQLRDLGSAASSRTLQPVESPLGRRDHCGLYNYTFSGAPRGKVFMWRTPAGDTLLATVDQQVKEAVEAERRRLNELLMDSLGKTGLMLYVWRQEGRDGVDLCRQLREEQSASVETGSPDGHLLALESLASATEGES